MCSLRIIIILLILQICLSVDATPALNDSDSPLEYLQNKGIETDVEIVVEDSEVFGKLFELIEASVKRDDAYYPALAWCDVIAETPYNITLTRGTSFLDAINQVANSLGLSVVQVPWGCLVVNRRNSSDLDLIGEQIRKNSEKITNDSNKTVIFTGNMQLHGVNPSDRETLNFLEERITERANFAKKPTGLVIVWEKSANPNGESEPLVNICGTQSASFFGNWRADTLLDTFCLFYDRSWELKDGVVTILRKRQNHNLPGNQ